jgi:hypothetical protein
MAALLQHRAAALITWIQTAGTTGNCLARPAPGIGSTARPGNSGRANHALRLKLDHLIGAGHSQALTEQRVRKATPQIRIKVPVISDVVDTFRCWLGLVRKADGLAIS